MAHSCSTCRALHILCTRFPMMEFSTYLGEALVYFNGIPYGVIKMNRKGYTQKPHKLRNTCLLQVWRTADSKGLLRIKRKMSFYPAGQTESCWAAIWMPKHICVINAQRPDETKGKHQRWTNVESGFVKQLSKQPLALDDAQRKRQSLCWNYRWSSSSSKVTASPSTRATSHYSPNKVISSSLRKSTLNFSI